MTLAPRSLFGRLVLVLLGGLLVAQLLTGFVQHEDRVKAVYRQSGMLAAQRVASILKLLDGASDEMRRQIVAAVGTPVLRVTLGGPPAAGPESADRRSVVFRTVLRGLVGRERPLHLTVSRSDPPPAPGPGGMRWQDMRAMMGGRFAMGRTMMGGDLPPQASFVVHTRLADGEAVRFEYRLPEDDGGASWRLLVVIGVLLLSVVAVSLLAVRWVTRPLSALAAAAEELGQDIHRPPLPERGPLEVERAARAFNTMQRRIGRYLEERTRFLAALSHDLRTPITRLLLRNEFVQPAELQERFAADLEEMEQMVSGTLELMRGLESAEPVEAVDVLALLETLQADERELGRDVRVTGGLEGPFPCRPLLLKRCFENLLGNALRYGSRAWITLEDRGDRLVVTVEDDGPGIPAAQRERVFEPFYRLETSRSRATGGTGLGLAIVHSVVEMHRGTVRLGDSAHGGLAVTVELPRRAGALAAD